VIAGVRSNGRRRRLLSLRRHLISFCRLKIKSEDLLDETDTVILWLALLLLGISTSVDELLEEVGDCVVLLWGH